MTPRCLRWPQTAGRYLWRFVPFVFFPKNPFQALLSLRFSSILSRCFGTVATEFLRPSNLPALLGWRDERKTFAQAWVKKRRIRWKKGKRAVQRGGGKWRYEIRQIGCGTRNGRPGWVTRHGSLKGVARHCSLGLHCGLHNGKNVKNREWKQAMKWIHVCDGSWWW